MRVSCKDGEDYQLIKTHDYLYERKESVHYDGSYFDKCFSYEGTEIEKKINQGRIDFVRKYYKGFLLDIGVGCGTFIKRRPMTLGYDINPKAVEWLKQENKYSDKIECFDAFSFWDVLEHINNHSDYLCRIRVGTYLFCSIPVFFDLGRIKESKHYRPGEHLHYWTASGLIDYMKALYGFECLEVDDFETQAGREDILSFAFKKYA